MYADVVQTLGDRILSVLELDRVTDIPTGIDVRLIKAVLKTIDVICKSKTSAFKMLLVSYGLGTCIFWCCTQSNCLI